MLITALEWLSYLNDFPVVFAIVLLGWLFIDTSIFRHLAYLACLSIIVNVALKGTFKVPLPPELHVGYAFPSGHMQFATVFYGWIFYQFHQRALRLAIAAFLVCIAIHMLIHHYHTVVEILAGFTTAVILIQLYRAVINRFSTHFPMLIVAFSGLLMIYNLAVYTSVPSHTWHAFWVLLGVTLVDYGSVLKTIFWPRNQESEIFADMETRLRK